LLLFEYLLQDSKRRENVMALPPPTGVVSWRASNPAPQYEKNEV
jgi:hypothetical protein